MGKKTNVQGVVGGQTRLQRSCGEEQNRRLGRAQAEPHGSWGAWEAQAQVWGVAGETAGGTLDTSVTK